MFATLHVAMSQNNKSYSVTDSRQSLLFIADAAPAEWPTYTSYLVMVNDRIGQECELLIEYSDTRYPPIRQSLDTIEMLAETPGGTRTPGNKTSCCIISHTDRVVA